MELRKMDIGASFYETDFTDVLQIGSAIQKVTENYARIDGIINNVGVNDSVALESSIDDFMDSLRLNLVSFFAVVKFSLPLLKNSKGMFFIIGYKVALTSQGGISGYAAGKGGVLGLTREWAVDLIGYGIRFNALIIAESYTPAYETCITSLENEVEKLNSIKNTIPLEAKLTTPAEIADTPIFVISDKSSHTTGQFFFVDGGYIHLNRALLSSK